VVDLQEFDWRTLDLNEGHTYSWAGTVRLDDDVLPFQRTSEIVHLEGDVCHGLDKLRIRGIVLVTLALDAEGIVEVVADSRL